MTTSRRKVTGERRREARALVRLAAPVAVTAIVNMGMSVTDTMMVSWFFGTEALAAVAVVAAV